jgi:uncharacterized protein YkwD
MKTRRRALLRLAPAIAALLACTASGGAQERRPAAPRAPSPPIAPPAPVSAEGSYGPEPEVLLSPVESRLLETARRRLGSGGSAPRPSPALSLAARELAARAAAGEPSPLAVPLLRGALARALSHDAAPAAYLVHARPDDAPGAVAELLRPSRASHVGAGAVERDGSLFAVVLASERKARLDPFPREVTAGTAAILSGELVRGLAEPQVFVAEPSGRVREVDVSGGRRFEARVAFPAPGRYAVEVVARGTAETEVAALLTVSAGGAPLDVPARPAPPPEPGDDAGAEVAVLDAMNDLRRARGLPPLARDDALTRVARGHSVAMRGEERVAHVLPGSAALAGRLRAAGVAYRRAFENVARGESALAAHASVAESPAHLANLLRPEARRAGIGVARGRLASGDPVVYLTEILIEPSDAASAETTAAGLDEKVRQALLGERARLGRTPLAADPSLDALAREAAESMRARDEMGAADLERRALRAARSVAAVDVFVASAPADATRSRNLPDARFSRVGVGVVPADSRRYGTRRLFIAVVYAD